MKYFFLGLVLFSMAFTSTAQEIPRDTVYVYETVIVYDTIRISDTLRIKKAHLNQGDSIFFTPTTATISENDIITHESINKKNRSVMRLKEMKWLTSMVLLLNNSVILPAQETKSKESYKTFPAQLSFVYPIGTHGNESGNYRYNLSMNVLTGSVGWVSGVEFGSLLNTADGVTGLQVAGIGNKTDYVRGGQFSGIYNINGTGYGTQISGIININRGFQGAQFSGIANLSENSRGLQVSGIVNLNQISDGAQISGIANISEESEGARIAGIVNLTEKGKGVQISGITNINQEFTGTGIAGVYNHTGILRGTQIGLVNVIDSVESGVAIGLINIVRKGFYDEWELSLSDYANVALSYKMGMKKFYTIFTVGGNFIEDALLYYAIGVGSRISISKKIDFQPELIGSNYNPWDVYTFVSRIKAGFVYNINHRVAISIAPSFYVLNRDADKKELKISSIPSVATYTHKNDVTELGFGISLSCILR
ncbi:MAG: hypothetical protein LBQ60_10320 [Bacteroidales bacterium]|jgi:hypothetical protein|nr:hypothetical protein [Bacteroidales bacterium]